MPDPEPCPRCQAPASERDRQSGFGGYEAEFCRKCGHTYEVRKKQEAPQ